MEAELEVERQRRFLTEASEAEINAAFNELKRQQESRKHVRIETGLEIHAVVGLKGDLHNFPSLSYISLLTTRIRNAFTRWDAN
jgi:hypothetical protein